MDLKKPLEIRAEIRETESKLRELKCQADGVVLADFPIQPGDVITRKRKRGEKRPSPKFCSKHLRRGNSSLEDSDANYIVRQGQGPDGSSNTEESHVVLEGILEMWQIK